MFLYITRYNPSQICTDDVGSSQLMTSAPRMSQRHPCRFSNGYISLSMKHWHLPFLYCWKNGKNVFMQNSRLIQACFPVKIDEVWTDRFCARYDWWRRLQPTSSVSPVCYGCIYFRIQETGFSIWYSLFVLLQLEGDNVFWFFNCMVWLSASLSYPSRSITCYSRHQLMDHPSISNTMWPIVKQDGSFKACKLCTLWVYMSL